MQNLFQSGHRYGVIKGDAGSEKFLSLANLWCHCVNTKTIPATHEPANGHSSVSISITQARGARDFWGSHRGSSQRSAALRRPGAAWARVTEPSSPPSVDCYCCADRWLLGCMAHSQTDHIHQNSTLSLFPSHCISHSSLTRSITHTNTHIYSAPNYVHEYTPYGRFTKSSPTTLANTPQTPLLMENDTYTYIHAVAITTLMN